MKVQYQKGKKKKKGKGNWLNNELPYASCLILLNSSKHCKWHGQFWCLSTQYLRDFYPTDHMLVTEWYKFETGRCLSYAYDDFLCRIISFFHFFLNRVQEKLKCLDSLKGICFPAEPRYQQIWMLCSYCYLKSCLWLGRMTAHLSHGFSSTAWPSHWIRHWASAAGCAWLF